MGKRGPRPTPTNVLKLHGSRRAESRVPEIQPDPIAPACPPWLDLVAQEKWKELAPELERLGVLTSLDGDALAAYCQAWSEFRQATETLQEKGRYVQVGSQPQPHPAVAQQRSAWGAMQKLGALFGLSPSARVGIPARVPKQVDELEAFLDAQ